MFRTVSLSIIRSLALYTAIGICYTVLLTACEQDQDDRKLSANLYDIYHCCVYSDKILMMDRGTV